MQTIRRKAIVIGGGIAGPAAAIALRRIGFEVSIFEGRDASAGNHGAFLNVAPNGVNALAELGVVGEAAGKGFHSSAIQFFNQRGRLIGELDSRNEQERFGARNLMMKRSDLHVILRDEAERQGAEYQFEKRLMHIDRGDGNRPRAHFDDGDTTAGDLILGCDGIHSRVRSYVLEDSPAPEYTGIVDCGGYSRLQPGAVEPGIQHMTFGSRAFFGFIARSDGEVWWFSNVPRNDTRLLDSIRDLDVETWRDTLLAVHREDPGPVETILRSTSEIAGFWPQYLLSPLERWHRGRVGLLGDAAHAAPPHGGQGASLALEDALAMAKCLRDVPSIPQALAVYEKIRRARVEPIVAQARRMGSQKAPGRIHAWFRDLLLPFFLRRGVRQAHENYGYRVDWEAPVAS